MNTKRVTALIVAMQMVILLAACGGTSQSGSTSNSDEPVQPSQQGSGQKIPSSSDAKKSGSTKEYEYKIYGNTAVITKYTGPEETVRIVVPSEFEGYPVVRIGDYRYGDVFAGLDKLEYIELPNTLQELGWHTFNGCKMLKTLELPESLSIIDGGCFKDSGLEAITIPPDVKKIGTFTFQNCTNLAWVDLPDGFETIESWAFDKCENLLEIGLPASLKTIGDYAFHSSGLVLASIPEQVEEMGDYIFNGCKNLEMIYIYNDPEILPEGTFYDCESLYHVAGLDSIVEIGNKAFYGCRSLEYIDLPEGLKTIDEHAFEYCSGLMELNLPSTVEYIGREAFVSCENISDVALPNSIKSIGILAFFTQGIINNHDVYLLVYNLNMPMPEMENAFPNGVCFVIGEDPENAERFEAELKIKNPAGRYDIENFYNAFEDYETDW